MAKLKCYRYIDYARNTLTRFKASSKTSLIKQIKRKTPVFAKGKKTTDFQEIKC